MYQQVPSLDIDSSSPRVSPKPGIYGNGQLKYFAFFSAVTMSVVIFLLTISGNSWTSEVMSQSKSKQLSVCEQKHYSKTTLKAAYEESFIALMKDTKRQKKFEASDIVVVGDFFYAVCDNSWAIERISTQLTPFSSQNTQVGDPKREKDDSGYEAIFHDEATNTFFVVRESVKIEDMDGEKKYHALVSW